MRTRSYVRYSDHKQDDGFSVEYQLTEINDFIIKNGLELQKHHIDQAISGTKVAGREAFFELIHDIKEGLVECVVVYKLNRMFRNAYESQKYRKLFKKHGVKLMSVTQQIDEDTSAGRLMTNVLSDIDQYQSETISDHVKSSMREMARQGYFTGGTVPFGYKLQEIENGSKKRKKYIPDEAESEVVSTLFRLYADNYSLRQLQQHLTAQGLKTRQGKMFGTTTIARMLKNDFYIGTLRYKTEGYDEIVIENVVPPIVPLDLWARVQERKQANKLVKPRKRKDLYALTGKIYCGLCGAHFFGIRSGSKQKNKYYDYKYYVCANRKNYRTCKCGQLRKDYIENLLITEIKKNILNDTAIDRLASEISALCKASPDKLSTELKELKKRRKELDEQLDELLDLKLKKKISADRLHKKSIVLEAELAEVENNIFSVEAQQKNAITSESVKAYLYSMLENVDTADEDILKNLFDHFVEKIIITDETADIYLIVRPLGQVAYKKTSGHPSVTLYSKHKRQ